MLTQQTVRLASYVYAPTSWCVAWNSSAQQLTVTEQGDWWSARTAFWKVARVICGLATPSTGPVFSAAPRFQSSAVVSGLQPLDLPFPSLSSFLLPLWPMYVFCPRFVCTRSCCRKGEGGMRCREFCGRRLWKKMTGKASVLPGILAPCLPPQAWLLVPLV